MDNKEIVFVYNADATLFADVVGFTQKLVAPSTQSCNLCGLTYGALGEKGEWREFLDSLPQKKTFLHRDEFHEQYPAYRGTQLPAVFMRGDDGLTLLVSVDEINGQSSITELKALLSKKLV